jgi:hypothetical protein
MSESTGVNDGSAWAGAMRATEAAASDAVVAPVMSLRTDIC